MTLRDSLYTCRVIYMSWCRNFPNLFRPDIIGYCIKGAYLQLMKYSGALSFYILVSVSHLANNRGG
jgi:hypothetical protein